MSGRLRAALSDDRVGLEKTGRLELAASSDDCVGSEIAGRMELAALSDDFVGLEKAGRLELFRKPERTVTGLTDG